MVDISGDKVGDTMRLKWKTINITDYVCRAVWSGSAKQACRKLQFSIAYNPDDKNMKIPDIQLGNAIEFYDDNGKHIFSGHVTTRQRKSEQGSIEYTAQDRMKHMLRCRGTYKFTNTSAEAMTVKVCKDAGIQVGKIASTKVNIPKKFFSDRSFYEIIMAGYTDAKKKTGKPYIAQMNLKKLDVIEKGKLIPKFWLCLGERILDSSYSETLDSMVNQVIVYNSDNNRIGSYKVINDVEKYGLFQNTIIVDEKSSIRTEAKAQIHGIEKNGSLSCIGDSRCVSGLGIRIKDSRSGMTGVYWIENDTHTWQDGNYTMQLNITFQNTMDEYEGDDEDESNGNSVSESTKVLNGTRVRAKFTAYYPANNAMEGGYYDALGNLLNPDKNTIAAPPSIAFHTKIQVLETGTAKDGQEYEVLDRGGAIQIESGNIYHFDILMHNYSECEQWGVRTGYAIIGNGTGYKTVTTSPTGKTPVEKVLEVARKYIGYKEYGTNLTVFGEHYGWNGVAWCCIFCWDVFRMAGVSNLFYGGGKCAHCFTVMDYYAARGKTSMSPKAGDIVIFWGAGGLGHMGIVESVSSNGGFTSIEGNASSNSDGVYRIYNSDFGRVRTFCHPFS